MNIIGQHGNQFLFVEDLDKEIGIIVDLVTESVIETSPVYEILDRFGWEEIYDRELSELAERIANLYGVGEVKVNPPPPLTITYADVAHPPLHTHCLVDGQVPIYTSKGWVPIRDVGKDDLVLTHKGRFRKVTEVIRVPKQRVEVTKFGINKNFDQFSSLTLTSDHPVLINNKWKPVGDVQIGDKFRFLSSQSVDFEFLDAEVKKIEKWVLRKPRCLYNLSVEEDESYVAKGFVVHNCRCTLLPVIKEEYR